MLRSACGLNVGMFFLMCVLGCVRGEERLVEVLEGEEGDDELLDKVRWERNDDDNFCFFPEALTQLFYRGMRCCF